MNIDIARVPVQEIHSLRKPRAMLPCASIITGVIGA